MFATRRFVKCEGSMSTHWNNVYATHSSDSVSWYEPEPTTSLELFDAMGVTSRNSLIDVGGGESLLVDRLLARGHRDVTILDLSATALQASLSRLESNKVAAIESDVTTWHPTRTYDVWHGRAALHFIDDGRQSRYFANLLRALSPGAPWSSASSHHRVRRHVQDPRSRATTWANSWTSWDTVSTWSRTAGSCTGHLGT